MRQPSPRRPAPRTAFRKGAEGTPDTPGSRWRSAACFERKEELVIRFFTSLLFALLFSTVVAVALQWGAEARAQGISPGSPTAGLPDIPGGGGTGHCPTQSCPHPGNPC